MVSCDNVPYFFYPQDSNEIDTFWEKECGFKRNFRDDYAREQNEYLSGS